MNQSDNLFNDIIKKVDIVNVVSHYVKLEKKGRNFVGLCPFHDDKNLGNFYVSPEKQIFKCFSCGKSGNAIEFVKSINNSSYLDAAKKISETEGIVVPELISLNKNKNPKIEKTFTILNDINEFYMLSLFQSNEGKDALSYLYSRGLNDEIIRKFDIGYSPKDGKKLISYLTKEKKYSLQEINHTGIIDLGNNIIEDKNHGRISFGIRNENNKICAFSCRIFGSLTSNSKYINTSSTLVFEKSKILYNFPNATLSNKNCESIYLVEGFMDAIAIYKCGFSNAVALMGTALTIEHIKLIKNLKVKVILCLDLDEPGQKASLNAYSLFKKYNIECLFVNNYNDFKYKDCDEICSNLGEKELKIFLSNIISFENWIINYYKKFNDINDLKTKEKIISYFNDKIVTNDIYSKKYLEFLSNTLNIDKESILNTVLRLKNSNPLVDEKIKNNINHKKNVDSKLFKQIKNYENIILYYLICEDNSLKSLDKHFSFYTKNNNKILKILKEKCIGINDKKERISIIGNEVDDNLKKNIGFILNQKIRVKYTDDIFKEYLKNYENSKNIYKISELNNKFKKTLADKDDTLLAICSNIQNKHKMEGDKYVKKSEN